MSLIKLYGGKSTILLILFGFFELCAAFMLLAMSPAIYAGVSKKIAKDVMTRDLQMLPAEGRFWNVPVQKVASRALRVPFLIVTTLGIVAVILGLTWLQVFRTTARSFVVRICVLVGIGGIGVGCHAAMFGSASMESELAQVLRPILTQQFPDQILSDSQFVPSYRGFFLCLGAFVAGSAIVFMVLSFLSYRKPSEK